MLVDYNGFDKKFIRKRKLKAAAFLFAVAAYSLALIIINPKDFPVQIPCLFYEVTGLYCPGCGGNRGAFLILHGDILTGLKNNLLLLIFIPGFVLASLNEFLLIVTGKQFRYPEFKSKVLYGLVVAVLLYWILRNLPFEGFSVLKP